MRRRLLEGDIVVDTSILVEIAFATEDGKELTRLIVDDAITPHTTTLNFTEAFYVICRLLGVEEAEKRTSLMLNSGYFNVVSSDRVGWDAARCKCLFPVSIVDCHTLALARKYSMPALFYRAERELEPIVEDLKEWLGNKILFFVKQ